MHDGGRRESEDGPDRTPGRDAHAPGDSTGWHRVQQVLEAVGDPFLLLNREWRVRLANRPAAGFFARSPAEMGGAALSDLVPAALAMQIVRAAGEGSHEPRALETTLAQRKCEVHVHAAAEGASVVIRDVSERVLAEELARRMERHASLRADIGEGLARGSDVRDALQRCCQALVDNLTAALARVWLVDADGQTLELAASAGMYTPLDGAHARVSIGSLKVGKIGAERQPHLSNDLARDPEISDREWAERQGMVAFAGYPLLVAERLIGVMVLFSRTEVGPDTLAALAGVADAIAQGLDRLRAERELEERAAELARSNAELERFAYVASHDLQEPLRMVASYTQLLARRYQDQLDADAHEFIGYAVDGVTRMQALINDLLAYSRVGTRGKQFAPVPLDDCLRRALGNLRLAVQQGAAEVTHDPLPTIVGDDVQLVQVFQNLIANSIKFRGGSPPKVHVFARRIDKHTWEVAVRDNGIGIAPEYFDKVFVIFQRLHTRTEYAGNGIGLAICKKIVERHGGRIWIESEPDRGASVCFTLPAVPRRRLEKPSPGHQQTASARSRNAGERSER